MEHQKWNIKNGISRMECQEWNVKNGMSRMRMKYCKMKNELLVQCISYFVIKTLQTNPSYMYILYFHDLTISFPFVFSLARSFFLLSIFCNTFPCTVLYSIENSLINLKKSSAYRNEFTLNVHLHVFILLLYRSLS